MENHLDFSGRTQLYFQLYDLFYQKINAGEYPPGSVLPTENELIERYKVSRITVRKAMDLLLSDGLILKKRGSGTFVQRKKMAQTMQKVLHFSEEMQKNGIQSRTEMLTNTIVPASLHVAEALSIDEREPLINVYRIRYADDLPVCIESAFLIKERCPDVLQHNFSQKSLRRFLEETYQLSWSHARQKIFAINASPHIAKQLGVAANDALLHIERISYTSEHVAGEFLQGYYRGDSYYLTTELNV